MEKEGKSVQFILDGQSVEAAPGETVLHVARRHDIRIPTLCHHESLSPYASCRLCLVEAFWGKRSKVVTSCVYEPWENERIETNNQRVRRARRMVIELLLARCPGAKPIRELASEYGIEAARFPVGHPPGPEDCILCGLCVRVCDDVVGQHAIGYANRGMERFITTPYGDQGRECIGCGACVFVCPTGAIRYEDIDGERVLRGLNIRLEMVKCSVCGKFFETAKQIEEARHRVSLPEELARTCYACRGATFGETLKKVLNGHDLNRGIGKR